ncbi:MAG: polyribonucleotide nucleotidyltransferase, partial [Clostridiales Family XIII bacterium]|nr:polyribonucleotide nucleotidyltransferase [Clostridiales Family XIII bacterium]
MGRFTDYKTFKTALGGRLLIAEIGKVAEQANGAVTVRYGDTVVNVTATMAKTAREGIDFFPLSCEYEEKMYAAGKIPGGFIKRESRPSEGATLTARLMDRPIRPLFPKGFKNDVQVIATVLSVDHDAPPSVAAMIGSSIALSVSDIPFEGPTASVIVGLIDDRFIVNPTQAERALTQMTLTVSGTREAIMMVEAGASEIAEEKMIDAIFFAHEEIKKIIEFIDEIVAEVGKEKAEVLAPEVDEDLKQKVTARTKDGFKDALHTADRQEQYAKIKAVNDDVLEALAEEYEGQEKAIKQIAEDVMVEEFRSMILDEGIRPDGRNTEQIRPV